jgi:hypothetical protein
MLNNPQINKIHVQSQDIKTKIKPRNHRMAMWLHMDVKRLS